MAMNEELQTHVLEQIDFLMASARSYDAGSKSESKRMAVSARVLLHDTLMSHALLVQTGHLDAASTFLSVGDPVEEAAFMATGPLLTISGFPLQYSPKLVDPLREVAFQEWWSETVFQAPGEKFSRKRIVLDLANRGGGAHVDPSPTNSYRRVVEDHSIGMIWVETLEDGTETETLATDMNNPLVPAMRTIAHELLRTIPRL